jgi:hypothetical protein
MSVTFTNSPAGSNRDLIRILINDTTGRLSDEYIAYSLTAEPSVWYAAALCAETISGQFSQSGDLTVGDLSIRRSISEYRNLAKTLRARGSRGAVPFAGGLTVSDKDTEKTDTDRVKPAFSIGMHDDPATDST